ncbi:hypothetical protein HDK64DRAFT_57011 [Phyllosticta capitalensis]
MSSAGNSGNVADNAVRAALRDMFDLAMNDPDALDQMTQEQFFQRYPNVPLELWAAISTPLNAQVNLDFYSREMELADQDMYDDDGSGDSGDSGDEDTYHPTAPITERRVEPPQDFSPRCGYSSGNSRANRGPCVNCACSKWGYRCSPSTCGCSTSCQNPFNILPLEDLFGSASVKLHPCFVTWILKRGYKKAGPARVNLPQITRKWLFDRVQENMDISDFSESYNAWVKQWETVDDAADDNPRKIHLMRSLLRLAFEEGFEYGDELHDWFFSFCRKAWGDREIGTWQQGNCTWHCRGCGECGDWRDWHCRTCNNCSYGISLRCRGCKGVCDSYHENHKWEERMRTGNFSDGLSDAGSLD